MSNVDDICILYTTSRVAEYTYWVDSRPTTTSPTHYPQIAGLR
jgi:hypothetical protein